MNHNFLLNKLAGQWVVQSAYGRLLESFEPNSLFVNQIKWTPVDNSNSCLENIRRCTKKKINLNSVNIYLVESSASEKYSNKNYIVFISQQSKLELIMKFDQNFRLLSKFIVQNQSSNSLTCVSPSKHFVIIEKVYFLNHNLKISKSTIQLSRAYTGTAFSSEIRIG